MKVYIKGRRKKGIQKREGKLTKRPKKKKNDKMKKAKKSLWPDIHSIEKKVKRNTKRN